MVWPHPPLASRCFPGHWCAGSDVLSSVATVHTWYLNMNPGQVQPEAFLSMRASTDTKQHAEGIFVTTSLGETAGELREQQPHWPPVHARCGWTSALKQHWGEMKKMLTEEAKYILSGSQQAFFGSSNAELHYFKSSKDQLQGILPVETCNLWCPETQRELHSLQPGFSDARERQSEPSGSGFRAQVGMCRWHQLQTLLLCFLMTLHHHRLSGWFWTNFPFEFSGFHSHEV